MVRFCCWRASVSVDDSWGLAYAIVGVVELWLDRKFPSVKTHWDKQATWLKILISAIVIVTAFLLCAMAVPFVASLIYG